MTKKFGIDIDGTVTSPETFVPHLNKAFNLNLTLEDITEYDFSPFVNVSPAELGNGLKQMNALFMKPLHLQTMQKRFCKNGIKSTNYSLLVQGTISYWTSRKNGFKKMNYRFITLS